ncbi:MAG: U32 family peptidase [Oscillospiraceae bacterium]|nr:U32 family peptidase [Oscillospiraceae bacterium]
MEDKKLELLSPAGDMERLKMAILYGADAVYMGGKRFGMRAQAGNFSRDELKTAVELCHAAGVKAYITCNNVMRNGDVRDISAFLENVGDIGADAVIVSDIGVMAMARRYAPNAAIHVSTQAGVANYESARILHDMGASRVILARELTLSEVAEIRAKTPRELEIEVFAHGSMCVSFSGRCLLSNYMTARDANRGACAQPCRWKYHLVEERGPGEHFEITEDGGTYIMNSRDLCMIEHIPELLDAGVDSVKIEGRTKSAYYVSVITNAYRRAADAAMAGEALGEVWKREVYKVSHRPYSTGFFFDRRGPGQHYEESSYFADCDVAAQVESCDESGNATLTQRNKFYKGDTLELIRPNGEPVEFVAERIFNADGEEIDSTPHPMMELRMKLPVCAPRFSFVRKGKKD